MKNKVKLYGDVIKHFTKLDSLWWIANLYWVRLCRCFSYTRFVWGWLMSMFWFHSVCMRLIDVDVLVSSGLLCPISHLYQNSIQTHLMPSVKKIMIKKTVKSAWYQCTQLTIDHHNLSFFDLYHWLLSTPQVLVNFSSMFMSIHTWFKSR